MYGVSGHASYRPRGNTDRVMRGYLTNRSRCAFEQKLPGTRVCCMVKSLVPAARCFLGSSRPESQPHQPGSNSILAPNEKWTLARPTVSISLQTPTFENSHQFACAISLSLSLMQLFRRQTDTEYECNWQLFGCCTLRAATGKGRSRSGTVLSGSVG